jgi:predicted DNA-binding protein (MmcQ/YjbR family)
MRRRTLLALCRRLPHATEDVKWEDHLVFSVGGKMFASLHVDRGDDIGFKATPENFKLLTQQPGIVPTPYAARFHWITVKAGAKLPLDALCELVRESHRLVFDGLTAKLRRSLGADAPPAARVKQKLPTLRRRRKKAGA